MALAVAERAGAELAGLKNDAGESPLQMALKAGLEEVALKMLEKAGKKALEMRDGKGESLLHAAARVGLTEVSLSLLSLAGDDFAGMQNELGETAMLVAINSKKHKVALALLQKMPEAALRACDSKGESLLHAAVRFGLTEPGAPPVLKDHMAQQVMPKDRLKRGDCPLCGKGVYTDQPRTVDDRTYYHDLCLAAKEVALAVAERAGAELAGLKNDAGESPLQMALKPGLQAIVECPAGHAMEMLSSGSFWTCNVCVRNEHQRNLNIRLTVKFLSSIVTP